MAGQTPVALHYHQWPHWHGSLRNTVAMVSSLAQSTFVFEMVLFYYQVVLLLVVLLAELHTRRIPEKYTILVLCGCTSIFYKFTRNSRLGTESRLS